MRIQLNIKEMYPLCTIESLSPESINFANERIKRNNDTYSVSVINYNGYYLIIDGIYDVIALANIGAKEILVNVVDRSTLPFWKLDDNVKRELQSLGMNAIYDFEALSGITYAKYPEEYKLNCEE